MIITKEQKEQVEQRIEERGPFKDGEICDDCRVPITKEELGHRTTWITLCKRCWLKRMLKHIQLFSSSMLAGKLRKREDILDLMGELDMIEGEVLDKITTKICYDDKDRPDKNLVGVLFDRVTYILEELTEYLKGDLD